MIKRLVDVGSRMSSSGILSYRSSNKALPTMITKLIVLLLLACFQMSYAHNAREEGATAQHTFVLSDGSHVDGNFLYLRDGIVHLQRADGTLSAIALESLEVSERSLIVQRQHTIEAYNRHALQASPHPLLASPSLSDTVILAFCIGFVLSVVLYIRYGQKVLRLALLLLLVSGVSGLLSFKQRQEVLRVTQTRPSFLDSAFSPFKGKVVTSYDAQYYHVQSLGIPDHPMMRGITGWQQQVPLPQCYTGSNAWSIPMNPVFATDPIPVNPSHFSRGAIAIAVNGIPIFNPYTNTGVDALLDGQLDEWGGHCGRADDYHYHVAPLHLYPSVAPTQPIAIAFDGYAVYGALEPDGSSMTTLDSFHGHVGSDGVYHYHGSTTAPYMIATMKGQVSEDSTHQLIPQAQARPVRPGQNPLKGAVITDCSADGSNGYVLTYTLNNQVYKVSFHWTNKGVYTFDFINPGGSTQSVYNGQAPCTLVSSAVELDWSQNDLQIKPQPCIDNIDLSLPSGVVSSDVTFMRVYSIDAKVVWQTSGFSPRIQCSNFAPGLYFVELLTNKRSYRVPCVKH